MRNQTVFCFTLNILLLLVGSSLTIADTARLKDKEGAILGLSWKSPEAEILGSFILLEGNFESRDRSLVWNGQTLVASNRGGPVQRFTLKLPVLARESKVSLEAVEPNGSVTRQSWIVQRVTANSTFWTRRFYLLTGTENAAEWAPEQTLTLNRWAVARVGTEWSLWRAESAAHPGWGVRAGAQASYSLRYSSFSYPIAFGFQLEALRKTNAGAISAGVSFERTSLATIDRMANTPSGQVIESFQSRGISVLWFNARFETPLRLGPLGSVWRISPRVSKSLWGTSSSADNTSVLSLNRLALGWRLGTALTIGPRASRWKARAMLDVSILGGEATLLQTEASAGLEYGW